MGRMRLDKMQSSVHGFWKGAVLAQVEKRCLGAQKRKKLAVQAAAQMKPARLSTWKKQPEQRWRENTLGALELVCTFQAAHPSPHLWAQANATQEDRFLHADLSGASRANRTQGAGFDTPFDGNFGRLVRGSIEADASRLYRSRCLQMKTLSAACFQNALIYHMCKLWHGSKLSMFAK